MCSENSHLFPLLEIVLYFPILYLCIL